MHRTRQSIASVAAVLGWLTTSSAQSLGWHQSDQAWPAGFTAADASKEPGQEQAVDFIGLRVKLTLPESWVVRRTGPDGALVAMDLANGLRLEIAEAKPTDFNLVSPIAAERLADSIKTMQAH